MDIVITRPSLPPVTLTRAACQAILNDLVARQQAYVEQDGIVYWRMPPALGLFIIYVTYFPNRRLVERFQLSYNPNMFEGMQFRGDACTADLAGALTCIGRVFDTPLSLSALHMGVYRAPSQNYVIPGQLCYDGGAWSSRPAALRTLTSGPGISLSNFGDTHLQISVNDVPQEELPPNVIVYTETGPGTRLTNIPGISIT